MQTNESEKMDDSSEYEPYVMSTIFTICVDDEDHRFSVSADGGHAVLEYDETLSFRGEIRVSEPRNEVFKLLMQSDEMTEYLESEGLNGVRRNR